MAENYFNKLIYFIDICKANRAAEPLDPNRRAEYGFEKSRERWMEFTNKRSSS